MPEMLATAGAIRTAAARGDYRLVADLAAEQAPDMLAQIEQYRIQMETYEATREVEDWRRALRALADARLAAIGAGLPELEAIATEQLFLIVKHHQGRRE